MQGIVAGIQRLWCRFKPDFRASMPAIAAAEERHLDALSQTVDEWQSPEDTAAYRDLGKRRIAASGPRPGPSGRLSRS
jgi:hypothetical protein